jgi:hypothetical protein
VEVSLLWEEEGGNVEMNLLYCGRRKGNVEVSLL